MMQADHKVFIKQDLALLINWMKWPIEHMLQAITLESNINKIHTNTKVMARYIQIDSQNRTR